MRLALFAKRVIVALVASVVMLAVGVSLAIAMPQMLFDHELRVGRLNFHSERSLNRTDVAYVVADAEQRLMKSAINDRQNTYELFIVESRWKRKLLFAPAGDVGGVTYFPLANRNVFLSGAIFEQNRLVSQHGYVPLANRTLSYFIAHEITHLQEGARVGTLAYVLMPRWIREGFADRIGLGHPSDRADLAASLAHDVIDPKHWNRFGYYSDLRLVVDTLLDQDIMPVNELLRSRMSFEKAKSMTADAIIVPPAFRR
jgi:hypothetical protein